jgi:hypothetical protein
MNFQVMTESQEPEIAVNYLGECEWDESVSLFLLLSSESGSEVHG